MKEESIMRKTLLTVGVLVGATTAWVGLLSIVLVTLTGHALARTEPGPGATPAPTTAPLPSVRNSAPKPNG
jgi:hypothetical protein